MSKPAVWIFLSFLFISCPAFAAEFLEFKIVGSGTAADPLSRIEKKTFSFDETPFVYMRLSEAVAGSLKTVWTGEDGAPHSRTRTIALKDGLEFWLSPRYWSDDRQFGDWRVSGSLLQGTQTVDTALTSFVVTPEPLSLALFGMGGLSLVWRMRGLKGQS